MDFFVHRNEKCGHRREVTVSGSLTVDEKATNDRLNTDRDMAYSSKCKMTIFKIRLGTYAPPPPPSKRTSSLAFAFHLSSHRLLAMLQ